jgi:hypothetical protein
MGGWELPWASAYILDPDRFYCALHEEASDE